MFSFIVLTLQKRKMKAMELDKLPKVMELVGI